MDIKKCEEMICVNKSDVRPVKPEPPKIKVNMDRSLKRPNNLYSETVYAGRFNKDLKIYLDINTDEIITRLDIFHKGVNILDIIKEESVIKFINELKGKTVYVAYHGLSIYLDLNNDLFYNDLLKLMHDTLIDLRTLDINRFDWVERIARTKTIDSLFEKYHTLKVRLNNGFVLKIKPDLYILEKSMGDEALIVNRNLDVIKLSMKDISRSINKEDNGLLEEGIKAIETIEKLRR